MNPYQPPNQQPSGDAGSDFLTSTGSADHPLYALVLKMVIWGEEREEIYGRMRVNGITAEAADRLYQRAWEDRIRVIRGECSRKLLTGIGLVLAAVITFMVCWFGLRFIPKILLYGCIVAFVVGAWKLIDGTSGFLMAASKKGPVDDV